MIYGGVQPIQGRQFPNLALYSRFSATQVIQLLICLLILSGCATTVLEIEDTLHRKALEGNVNAQYEIGMKYHEAARGGWRWNVDPEYSAIAQQWFEVAASQGDAKAQYQLSNYYFGRKDYGRSFELTRLAAQQGVADAQYSLGMHYGQAWGTQQNLILAYKWIALANDGGVSGGGLADVEWLIWKGNLTTDQIAEGKRLAAEHIKIYGRSKPIKSLQ